jgi:hypothetical protein
MLDSSRAQHYSTSWRKRAFKIPILGVTEIVEMPNREHALVVDSGWREVADTALAFIKRVI